MLFEPEHRATAQAPVARPSQPPRPSSRGASAPPPSARLEDERPVPNVVPTSGTRAPDAAEEAFFEDTIGANSQPFTGEIVLPRRSRALPIVIALGFVIGIIGTVAVMNSGDGEVPTADAGAAVVVPVVKPATDVVAARDEDAGDSEVDGGALAAVEQEPAADVADAGVDGPALVAAVTDAGRELLSAVDSRVMDAAVEVVAATTARDAGAVAQVREAPSGDAGGAPVVAEAVPVAAKDAGASPTKDVALAGAKDAGAAFDVVGASGKDAGAALARDVGAARPGGSADAGAAGAAGGALSDAQFGKLLDEGKAALVAERWGTAVKLFRKAVGDRPGDATARAGLGIALVFSETGFREAIPHLKEATKVDPANARAWLALGIALQNLGRDAEAKAPYRKFLELSPTSPQAAEVRAALQAIP
ncbi:MAG: tetratricopeptide repeat protein [Myxococcaceae bacterium]|nr:tetratricopeptide repeat protein [Myxococcaceae bacterium]